MKKDENNVKKTEVKLMYYPYFYICYEILFENMLITAANVRVVEKLYPVKLTLQSLRTQYCHMKAQVRETRH